MKKPYIDEECYNCIEEIDLFSVKVLYDMVIYKFLSLIKNMGSNLRPIRKFNQ